MPQNPNPGAKPVDNALPGAAPTAVRREPRSARIEARERKKRIYQQEYRDKHRGLPDNRRIGAEVLRLILEQDASSADGHHDALFAALVDRLARVYNRNRIEKSINALRDAACEAYENEEFRKRVWSED